MLPVPNGLAPDVAALTEPMAVAWHAVRRGEVGKKQVAIVIGCGPVGLGVILMLKAERRAHGRRQRLLARAAARSRARAAPTSSSTPAAASPFTAAGDRGHLEDMPVRARARRRDAREARPPAGRLVARLARWPRSSARRPSTR